VFSTLDDGLISDEDSAVELRSKVTNEFFTAGHVLVDEDVLKFMDEAFIEKLSYQLKPKARLELF